MSEITEAICPRCQQRFIRMPYSGDFEHKCHGTAVLANEDILVIGDWEDFTGSDFNVNNPLKQGTENKLFGTRADIEGEKEPPQRTSRGFPTNRFRTRQHIHWIPDKFFKIESSKPDNDPEEYHD